MTQHGEDNEGREKIISERKDGNRGKESDRQAKKRGERIEESDIYLMESIVLELGTGIRPLANTTSCYQYFQPHAVVEFQSGQCQPSTEPEQAPGIKKIGKSCIYT